MKWEDKLYGREFTIITDHKAATFFDNVIHSNPRRLRWSEYMSRFGAPVKYIEGLHNIVGDCMSRYFEADDPSESHQYHDYVNADA